MTTENKSEIPTAHSGASWSCTFYVHGIKFIIDSHFPALTAVWDIALCMRRDWIIHDAEVRQWVIKYCQSMSPIILGLCTGALTCSNTSSTRQWKVQRRNLQCSRISTLMMFLWNCLEPLRPCSQELEPEWYQTGVLQGHTSPLLFSNAVGLLHLDQLLEKMSSSDLFLSSDTPGTHWKLPCPNVLDLRPVRFILWVC